MMEIKGLKFYIIIIVTIAIVGLFFTAQYLLDVYQIEKPLKNELASLEGVREIELIENNKSSELIVMVKFEPGIEFYNLYQEIERILEKILGSRSVNIIITNESISELAEVYYQVHFAIYEGINTGKFLEMKANIDGIVYAEELDNYRVWIDNEAVYLQLDKNNNSFYTRIAYNDINGNK